MLSGSYNQLTIISSLDLSIVQKPYVSTHFDTFGLVPDLTNSLNAYLVSADLSGNKWMYYLDLTTFVTGPILERLTPLDLGMVNPVRGIPISTERFRYVMILITDLPARLLLADLESSRLNTVSNLNFNPSFLKKKTTQSCS